MKGRTRNRMGVSGRPFCLTLIVLLWSSLGPAHGNRVDAWSENFNTMQGIHNEGTHTYGKWISLHTDTDTYLLRSEPRIQVARGRRVYLTPDDLFHVGGGKTSDSTNSSKDCRVRVKPDEPISEISGEIHPKIFDCSFTEGHVWYAHNGSPFTDKDVILLQIFTFSERNATNVQIITLNIDVIETGYDVIMFASSKQLKVDMESGLSETLDSSYLMFKGYGYGEDSYCSIDFLHNTWPRVGRLVGGLEHEEIRNFHDDCRDMLHKSYRYEYHGNATQHNVDYIPVTVSFYNGIGASNVTQEKYFIPVHIPIPNSYARPLSKNKTMVLEVAENELTFLNDALVNVVDSSGRYEYSVYHISYPQSVSVQDIGAFVHENEPSSCITSFTNFDLINGRIGYTNYRLRENDKFKYDSKVFKITAYNVFLQASQNVNLKIIIRNEFLAYDRPLIVTSPVFVNEGYTTAITAKHLVLPSNAQNLNNIELTVKAGLKHGYVSLNGNRTDLFMYNDLLYGEVRYHHDGSRAPNDRLSIRVFEPDVWSDKVRLPVVILPRDDSTPQIATNKELVVKEASFAVITRDKLMSRDRDSETLDIEYHIKRQPRLGVIEKAYRALSRGVLVTSFTQEDIDNGYIFFHHTSTHPLDRAVYDTFEFRLSDSVPNKSGSHIMGIKIIPRTGTPPIKSGSLSLTTKETEVTYITHDMLQYTADFSSEIYLTYTILAQPYFLQSSLTLNAGRIIAAQNMSSVVDESKRHDIPALWSFTLEDIDTLQVAYLPPLGDIGPVERQAKFMFSVTDLHGNNALDQPFSITILPVNNRAPQILVGDITVVQGEHVIITTQQIKAQDQDTEPDKLYFTLKQMPFCGKLVLGNEALNYNDEFSIADIDARNLGYYHDDCENKEDSIIVLLSDGSNSITTRIPIFIEQFDEVGYEDTLPNDEADWSQVEKYAVLENSVLDVEKGKRPSWFESASNEKEEFLNRESSNESNLKDTSMEETHEFEKHYDKSIDGTNTSGSTTGLGDASSTEDELTSAREGEITSAEHQSSEGYHDYGRIMSTGSSFLESTSRHDREHLPSRIQIATSSNNQEGSSEQEKAALETVAASTQTIMIATTLERNILQELAVMEMGEATISVANLDIDYASMDPETQFSFLPPTHGKVLLRDIETSEFSLNEVMNYEVVYRHTGGEIGTKTLGDRIFLRVITADLESIFYAQSIQINVTIFPVDNQRPVILLGDSIYVQEGESISLILDNVEVQDIDTPLEQITLLVARNPKWGYIENLRLHSLTNSLGVLGRKVESFSYTDLKNGYITYNQANHSGVEPVDDVIEFYASDGVHNSLPARISISILPINDEMPQFELEPIILPEGSSRILSPEFVKAFDLDRPKQRLALSLKTKPRHGELVLKYMAQPGMGEGFEIPMNDVTMNDIESGRMKLVYKHDDTEQFEDSFILQLTDGVHVARKRAHVRIIPQNDELPEIVENSVLTVEFGDTELITDRVLRTEDKDNNESDVRYTIISRPRKGMVQQKDNSTLHSGSTFASLFGVDEYQWTEINRGDYFTQNDVNNGKIRYVHTGTGSEKEGSSFSERGNFDKFVFQLSDGVNTLPPVSFDVDIVGSDSKHIALLNRGIKVKEGDARILSTDILSASEEGQFNPYQLAFIVTSEPKFGRLSFIEDNDTVILSFTQADIEARRVLYHHISKEDSHEDAIRFTVLNPRNQSRTGIFKIIIEPIDRILPSLDVNMPLTVIQDEAVILTRANLHISDPDTPPSNLTYTIVEPPHFGVLLLGGVAVLEFTQFEVDMNLLQYKNAGSNNAGVDYFLFTISDGHNLGFTVNGTIERKPSFFNFLVQPPERKPPTLVQLAPPDTLESLGNGRFGFIFTSENLKAVHPKRGNSDVVYNILDRPQNGYLQNLREFRNIRKKFSQKDIDEGNVAFMLIEGVGATSDNFTFNVCDDVSQSCTETQTFEMEWAVVEFAHSLHMVCEDAGHLLVVLQRHGSTQGSAYVEYKQKGMSARSGLDYRLLTTVKRVEFEPDKEYAAISIEISNDNIPEENEKFRLKLRKAKNAVIGSKDKTVIQIINLNEGKCDEYIGMVSRDDRDPLGFGYDAMFPDLTPPSKLQTTSPKPTQTTTAFNVFDYGLQLYAEVDDIPETESNAEVENIDFVPFGEDIKSNSLRPDSEKLNGKGDHRYYSLIPTPSTTVAPQECNAEIKNLLYFDMKTSKVYKCNGEAWQRWGWGAGYALNDAGTAQGTKSYHPGESAVQSISRCNNDWSEYEGSCYRMFYERHTWEEAREFCERKGTHLTNVNDESHLDWLWKLSEKERFWTGISSTLSGGSWKNDNDQAVTFYNWKPGYPKTDDTTRHRIHIKHCVLVIGKAWWVNRPCNRSRASFICAHKMDKTLKTAR